MVWCCADKPTERYLAEACAAELAVAEEGINLTEIDLAAQGRTTWRKIYPAKRKSAHLSELGYRHSLGAVQEREGEYRIQSTGVRPLRDVQHPNYLYVRCRKDGEGAFLSMSRVSPEPKLRLGPGLMAQ